MHIYPWQMDPLPIEHRCLEYHYTKLGRSIYIEQCIYTHGRLTPLQLSIDALNTATPNLADLYGRTMHIYPWQIDPPIKHRCLEYCYTKLGRSIYIEQCIYTHGRLIPPPPPM